MDAVEDRVAPFADDGAISILKKHKVQLIFGGESFLPDDFCGLGWVDTLRSENRRSDLFLQLHLDGSLSTSYSLQEISDGMFRRYQDLQRSAANSSNWIVCSESSSYSSSSLSSSCDGQVLLSSLHTARSLAVQFKAAYEERSRLEQLREAEANTCRLACRFPWKLLLSDSDRLAMMASTLASERNTFESYPLFESTHYDETDNLGVDFFSRESLLSWEQARKEEVEGSQLQLSDFTAVTAKFAADSKRICSLYWPLNNSEIFIFSRNRFSIRKHVLDFRLLCTIPDTVLVPLILQVDFLSDGEVLRPYSVSSMMAAADFLGGLTMAANMPPLHTMNLEPGHASVRVSLISSSDGAVITELTVNVVFKFGSDMEQRNSPPIPSYIHSEMSRLKREDFYGLLNSLKLTNVAVEVGVCEGIFARNMLSNWHGDRLATPQIVYEDVSIHP
jgi:hypothetical protein